MSNISTHFEMLMDAKEQERIGATPDTDEAMRVMRTLSHYAELLAFAQFVRHGLRKGAIRAQPFMDMSNPNASEWPVRTLAEECDKVLH